MISVLDFLWAGATGVCFLIGIYYWFLSEWVVKSAVRFDLDWKMPVVDSVFLFWWVIILIIGFQNLYTGYIKSVLVTTMGDVTWDALGQGLAFHFGIFILGIIFFKKRKVWPGPLRLLSWFEVFKVSFIGYCQILPVVSVTSYLWVQLLDISAKLGFEVHASEQSLVNLLFDIKDVRLVVGLAVLVVVIAPLTEEWLFRVGFYRFFKKYVGVKLSAIGTALVFACLHFNTLSFLPLFALGILLVYFYEKNDDWRVPYVIHGCFNGYNFISILLEGVVT